MQRRPAATGYDAASRFRFEGDGGDSPQNVPGENNQHNVDWVARQIGLAVDGDRLVIEQSVSAFGLRSQSRQARNGGANWRRTRSRARLAADADAAAATRPAAFFARRLHKAGPVLACFNSVDGKVMWTSKIEPEKWVVGDPLLDSGRVVRTGHDAAGTGIHTVAGRHYDPQSGAVLSIRPLIQFRETWWQERNCQVPRRAMS